MIKPKYPKRADLSQVARLTVEHAVGGSLMPRKPTEEKSLTVQKKVKRRTIRQSTSV